jgi:CheY-like chemotaxis protein
MIDFKKVGNKGVNNSSDGHNPKVLILEKEAIIAEDLRVRLEEMGYSITAVTNSPTSAIDLAKQNRPDILLLDLDGNDGDLNAAEIAVILQAHFLKILPVVFVTSYEEDEFPVLKALEAYVYCKKPFSDEDLSKSLAKANELRREENS